MRASSQPLPALPAGTGRTPHRTALATALLLAPLADALALDDPLDYGGGQFLGLYVPLLIASLIAAGLLRRWLRLPAADPRDPTPRLSVYETACLAGGAPRAIDTAIAVLAQRGLLRVDIHGLGLQAVGRPSVQDPTERRVLAALTRDARPAGLRKRACAAVAEELAGRLRAHGLVMEPGGAAIVRVLPALCTGSVLAFGLLKLVIGLSRNRPVGFLAVCCIGLGLATLWFLLAGVHRSRRGDALLKSLRTTLPVRTLNGHGDPRVPLALALFGAAAVAALLPAGLGELLSPPSGSGDSGSGSDSSDSGGGSDGDGGGGCGGCGGCGGGGD